MANTKSAKKAVRQIARRTSVNRQRRSKMRTFVRKVEEAILAGDQVAAQNALADRRADSDACGAEGHRSSEHGFAQGLAPDRQRRFAEQAGLNSAFLKKS